MCRWMAYMGNPLLLHDMLYLPKHSIVIQSLDCSMGAETTNGDGIGLGWYGLGEEPGQYRSTEPAWHDRNLKDLSKHIQSPVVFCHVRAASPSVSIVQQTNCHPFRHGKWLFMHNGAIRQFPKVKRDYALRIDPDLYPNILGNTDSEHFFFLALTFGLMEDPPKAIARTIGFIESVGHEKGIKYPMQGTLCVTNGEEMWAFRYSSEAKSRTLFYSSDLDVLVKIYPDHPFAAKLAPGTRLICSEPLGDLPGVWNEVPESTCVKVCGKSIELSPFQPSTDFDGY